MKIYCFDSGKGKNILAGEYNPFDSTFIKKVKPCHYMIKEHGFGIQEEVLQELKELGVVNILIITKTSQQTSLLEDWLKQPIKNYGHGNQRFLRSK